MSNPLDPVRAAFDRAVGPHRKRQVLIDELKEPDVGKERRAQMVEESGRLREEWLSALIELRKAMDQCPELRERLDK